MDIPSVIVGFISALVLSYLGYRYQLSQGKVNIKRERLLSNIAKVEQFLSANLEFEYINYELDRLEDRFDQTKHYEPQEILKWMNQELLEVKNLEESDQFYFGMDIAKKLVQKFGVSDLSSSQDKETLRLQFTVNNTVGESKTIARLKERLGSVIKETFGFDIIGTCLIIDSSGELLKYMNELMGFGFEGTDELRFQRSELRYKIRKFLEQKIN